MFKDYTTTRGFPERVETASTRLPTQFLWADIYRKKCALDRGGARTISFDP